jgi:serine/threonine-protein phosphatase 2A activator
MTDDRVINEVATYWKLSFGNGTRLDYGSGHELNFVAFLCCLHLIGFLQESDFPFVVLCVFDRYLFYYFVFFVSCSVDSFTGIKLNLNRYLTLVRLLQRTYMLEPAGSHGVWGLDDFQFLAYYFGACQLISMFSTV